MVCLKFIQPEKGKVAIWVRVCVTTKSALDVVLDIFPFHCIRSKLVEWAKNGWGIFQSLDRDKGNSLKCLCFNHLLFTMYCVLHFFMARVNDCGLHNPTAVSGRRGHQIKSEWLQFYGFPSFYTTMSSDILRVGNGHEISS